MSIDDALRTIGEFGRGQVMIVVAVSLMGQVPAGWNIFVFAFWGATPEFYCEKALDANSYDRQFALDKISADELSRCEQRVNTSINATIECEEEWVYSDEVFGSTVVSQWDLVCNRAWLVPFAQTSLMAGLMVGSVLFGYLADRFGRSRVFFIGLLLQGITGSIQILSPSFTIFVMFRFFSGVFNRGYEMTSYAVVSEWLTPRLRPYSTTLCLLMFWAVGLMTLPLIAFVTRDWKYLQLSISIPLLFALPLYWFIPESPRWLVAVGRYKEASDILNRVAKFNGKRNVNIVLNPPEPANYNHKETNFRENCEKLSDKGGKEETDQEKTPLAIKHTSYLDLFGGFAMSLVTTTIVTVCFLTASCYYGLSLIANSLVGNPYLNFFLSGAVEIPSYIVSTAVVLWFGRRRTASFFLVLVSTSCFAVSLIPSTKAFGKDVTAGTVVIAMIGKFAITVSNSIVLLLGTEVFPTVLRNKGFALLSVAAHMGGIVAPFINQLGDQLSGAPMILFGTTTLFPSLMIFLLPEMKERTQPQTVADVEQIYIEDKAYHICFRFCINPQPGRTGEAVESTNPAFVEDNSNQLT